MTKPAQDHFDRLFGIIIYKSLEMMENKFKKNKIEKLFINKKKHP